MIVTCSHCSTRLQLDDAKIPSRAFTVRCPKCQNVIHGQPLGTSNGQQSALGIGEAPSLENARYNPPTPAPAFQVEKGETDGDVQAYGDSSSASDFARALIELLQTGPAAKTKQPAATRLKWEHRRVLVCAVPARREAIAKGLAEENYQVYIAEDTSQAIERMREDKMDVVILDTEFDAIEQGAAFVANEINALRPAERRRLLFVQLSPSQRTLDTHAAFVQNVNLVVNNADIENLPRALERAIRDYNDLYRDFNTALNVASV